MKCPHCEYEDFIRCNIDDSVSYSDEGNFFEINSRDRELVQTPSNLKGRINYAHLYGCPSCTKTFIEIQ